MNLNTRPNGKATADMKKAIMAASVKNKDRAAAMQLWRDFKWKVRTTCTEARDIEALIDQTVVRINAEIWSDVLKAQLLTKFDILRKRVVEMGSRPDEFLGGLE